ncbi:MAG TPA: FeoA family protein [Gammaproteobacteria bacterium]|nr:FeoA family protein [Gammaproteobacteria bacterium]
MQSLSDLKLHEKAQVLRVDVSGAADRQKLFACGLIPGAEITIERIAPLGCPLQIRLEGDILLSIRKTEANYVKVNRINR